MAEYLEHAAERYHASYGSTPFTRAFLDVANLTALAQSFQARLAALYGKYGLDYPRLIIDESWVLELFEYLHNYRQHVRSVAEANAGFEHQFFKHLEVSLYSKVRHRQTLDGKKNIPVRYRREYSAANVPTQQLGIKSHNEALPLLNFRQHPNMERKTFAPNRSILTLERAKLNGAQ